MVTTKKRGRPKAPKGLRRSRAIEVLVRPQEYDEITKNARRAGLPMARYVRERALHKTTQDRTPDIIAGELADIGQTLRLAGDPGAPGYQKAMSLLIATLERLA